jgi:hypothetical protein
MLTLAICYVVKITLPKHIQEKINLFIWKILFKLYLHLVKYGYYSQQRNVVCDHLGVIDTLGHVQDNTRFTSSYNDEITSLYTIKLPFGFELNLWDIEEKIIEFKRIKN